MRLSWSVGAKVATASVAGLVAAGAVLASVAISHSSPAASTSASVAVPVVKLAHVHHGHTSWNRPFIVKVRKGTIRSVALRAGHDAVPGATNGMRSWRTDSKRLVPSTTYTAAITVADDAGRTTTLTRHFTTSKASHFLVGLMSPNDETVGVGEPVTIHFESPVPDTMRAAVERHVSVQTSPAVRGAWHWFDDQDVHWRPPSYWKPGTTVHVGMNLSSLYFGNGTWGLPGQHEVHFTIGDALISKASVPNHQMKVYDNGKLIRTMPISAGSTTYPTMGGIHVTLSKQPSVIMDSATVGIPKGSPGYYYETVYWDVRISDSGAYVHAAPWSVADQGNTNVSHGCINLSPQNAQWFYHLSHSVGDIVEVDDPQRGPSATDPGTEDWNMSWHQWLAGDALPKSQRAADYAIGATAHHARAAHHKAASKRSAGNG